jgi:hypothetical protein
MDRVGGILSRDCWGELQLNNLSLSRAHDFFTIPRAVWAPLVMNRTYITCLLFSICIDLRLHGFSDAIHQRLKCILNFSIFSFILDYRSRSDWIYLRIYFSMFFSLQACVCRMLLVFSFQRRAKRGAPHAQPASRHLYDRLL